MTKHPPIQIVDKDDQPTGQDSMDAIHKSGAIHRIVVVILKDEKDRILLQKRSGEVSTNQHKWDASAAGHVDAGEDYLTAAKRELKEELGIEDIDLQETAYYYSESRYDWRQLNRFRKVYVAKVPSDTKIEFNPEEISAVSWFTRQEIDELGDEVVDDFVTNLDRLDENHEHQAAG